MTLCVTTTCGAGTAHHISLSCGKSHQTVDKLDRSEPDQIEPH